MGEVIPDLDGGGVVSLQSAHTEVHLSQSPGGDSLRILILTHHTQMHNHAHTCTHTPGKCLLSTEIHQSGTPRTGKIPEDLLRASFSKLYVVTGRPTASSRPPSDPFRSNYSEVTTNAGTRGLLLKTTLALL